MDDFLARVGRLQGAATDGWARVVGDGSVCRIDASGRREEGERRRGASVALARLQEYLEEHPRAGAVEAVTAVARAWESEFGGATDPLGRARLDGGREALAGLLT